MNRPGSDAFETARARLAERLRELRIEKGLSQEELAHRAGCHPTYVSMMERRLGNPSLRVLAAIATALDASISDLTTS